MAQTLSVAEQKKIAVEGRDYLLKRDYDGAENFLTGIVERYPKEMIGFFGLMALTQVRNLENFDYRFDPPYLKRSAKGRELALKALQKPDVDPWSILMAGGILGTSGFYEAHNRHWLRGLRDGSTGFHALQKAYARDSSLTDALLGVGLYDYWRSHFTRKLSFLPFFPDRRGRAKGTLGTARDKGEFVGPFAEVSLAYIAAVEKKPSDTIEVVNRLLEKYPRNTIMRTLRGSTLIQLKRYDEALSDFEEILKIDPTLTKSYLFMGIAWLGKKEEEKGRELIEKFLELEPKATPPWKRLAHDPFHQSSDPLDPW